MGYSSIIRAFGVALLGLGLFMFAPFIVALSFGEKSADDYLFAAAITIFIGGALTVMGGADHKTADFRGAILFILLWWIIAPVFGGLPFLLGDGTFFDAYFEAVSALTTTGAWLSDEGARASLAGMFWRALLQWIGGLASLSIAAAIFIRPDFIGIDTLLPPFARGDKDSNLHALRRAAVSFSGVYCLFTALMAVLLGIGGAPLWDCVIMALSITASGGFIPAQDGVSSYSFGVIGALAPFIILSGANFILLARSLRGRIGRNKDVETGIYVIAIVLVGVIMWLAAGAGDLDLIPAQIFNAASLFSTNGVIIGEAPPLPLALVTVIIGGSAVSTAGGLKILRWLVVFSRVREEINRLITPNGVFGKSRVANELGIWIHFLVFTMTLGAITLAISLGGHAFHISSAAAIAALANAGPVIELAMTDMIDGAAFDGYALFDWPVRAVLCAAMILGRVETVVALAIFNSAFWRS